MATTVTYKGDVLTTLANQTKILKTAGKYMEDDVTVVDQSSTSAVVVTEELDDGGGIIKHITAIDLSNDTVDAAHLYTGYTAHDHLGNAIVGIMSGGGQPSLQSKSRSYTPTTSSQNEVVTYDSNYDGLSSVTITVSAIPSQYIIPTGSTTFSNNGTGIDIAQYATINIAVPTSTVTQDSITGIVTIQ